MVGRLLIWPGTVQRNEVNAWKFLMIFECMLNIWDTEEANSDSIILDILASVNVSTCALHSSY